MVWNGLAAFFAAAGMESLRIAPAVNASKADGLSRALNPQRRDPVFLAGHLPRGREPQLQRSTCAMKDRAEEAAVTAGCGQDRIDQKAGRGLAVGAGDGGIGSDADG